MTKSKDIGTKWEVQCAEFLRGWWSNADRRPPAGRYDKGDVSGPGGWTIECKNRNEINLGLFLREAKAEAANNGHDKWVVLIKGRRSKYQSGTVRDSFAVMDMVTWADTVKELEVLRELVASAANRGPTISLRGPVPAG